jgi:hypothetical protein
LGISIGLWCVSQSLADKGASYIHGTEGNPLTEIANRVGTKYLYSPESWRRYYDDEGKLLEEGVAGTVLGKVIQYSEDATEYSRENEVDKDHTALRTIRQCV